MDVNGYGRYVDESDGMPRWSLPPAGSSPRGLRWKYMGDAIRELYPDYGARFVADRLGMPAKYKNVIRYAGMFGVSRTEERKREAYGEMAVRLRRIFKMERARVMGGLRQVTRVNLGRGGVRMPQRFYSLRGEYVKRYGYFYCEGDVGVLLYDGSTRRRLPGSVRVNGFTEEEVTRRYGIAFVRADGEEMLDHERGEGKNG